METLHSLGWQVPAGEGVRGVHHPLPLYIRPSAPLLSSLQSWKLMCTLGAGEEARVACSGCQLGRSVLCYRRKIFCSCDIASSIFLQASPVLGLQGSWGWGGQPELWSRCAGCSIGHTRAASTPWLPALHQPPAMRFTPDLPMGTAAVPGWQAATCPCVAGLASRQDGIAVGRHRPCAGSITAGIPHLPA